MLTLNNSRDFYEKLLAEFDDFMVQQDSARHAMNCAITAHHMHDWVWSDYLKNDGDARARMGIGKDKIEFAQWIERHSVWYGLVRAISNGSKHFNKSDNDGVLLVNDHIGHGYVEPGYLASYLALDQGEGVIDARYMPLSMLFEVVVRFWRDFFNAYSPYKDLPKGKTLLADEQ